MLTEAGVPWEVATKLSRSKLLGYCVAVGEIRGRKWSWSQMEWQQPDR